MQILEYDDVDPLGVLYLNRLALGFALTPERVAALRRDDPRPFSGLAVYAEEDGLVVGQVGMFRLPMVSSEGREDVGGVWAVSTHPTYAGRGIATRLLEAAHDRMRAAAPAAISAASRMIISSGSDRPRMCVSRKYLCRRRFERVNSTNWSDEVRSTENVRPYDRCS